MADTELFSEQTDYKRKLGLMEASSIVVGRIIGSGIFRTPGPIMALVLSTYLFGIVWIIGGLVTIFGAVVYAELTAMMPRSGGPYVFLKAAYHPVVPFLRGWSMFFVAETGAIAAVALVFAEYFDSLAQILTGYELYHSGIIILALAVLWVLTLVNLFGVYLSGILQDIFSAVKIIALGAVIGACFVSAGGSSSHFSSPGWPEEFSGGTILAVGAGLRYAFFAFSGWEGATYVAEEVKNPRRNLPLSLFFGIGGVMILYAGANSAYLYRIPAAELAKSKWIAADAMQLALGSIGGIFISIAVMFNTFANVSTQILCKARTWQAMARDGLFFEKLAPLHKKYKTPNNAILAQSLWASVLLLFAGLAENSYESIIDFFSASSTIFNILTFSALFILRRKYPDAERPYKAWLYPYSLIIILLVYTAFLYITIYTAFWPSLYGLLLTSSGLIYYRFKRNKMETEIPD